MGIGRQVDRRKVLTENRLNRIFFVLFVVIVISKREQNFSFQHTEQPECERVVF